MKVKDLINELETGDRTMEMLIEKKEEKRAEIESLNIPVQQFTRTGEIWNTQSLPTSQNWKFQNQSNSLQAAQGGIGSSMQQLGGINTWLNI